MFQEKETVHIVPDFHYDVEYLKTYEEYRDLCVDNIIKAVRLLMAHLEYTFMVEQIILVQG